MKKILPIFISLIILITTYKPVNASQVAYPFYEVVIDNVTCLTTDDPNLPSTGNYYFGITQGGSVWYQPLSRAIPIILNKGIGITLKPEILVDFFSDYLEFGIINGPFNKPVYNGNTRIGYAYEDLSGKGLLGSSSTDTNITMPGTEVDNVYNYYNTWYTSEGYNDPDYVNVETRSDEFFLNKLNQSSSTYTALQNYINSEYGGLIPMSYSSGNLTYSQANYFVQGDINELYLVAYNNWSNFVSQYHISQTKSTVNFTDMMLNNYGGCDVKFYYLDNGLHTKNLSSVTLNTNGTYNANTSSQDALTLFTSARLPCSPITYLTVYKDTTVLNQFVNGTYAPLSFYSQDYYNYSSDNDNSFTATSNDYDNSNTTNETIYNNSAESFSEYYEENNYHVDNSVTINTTTEIINNYYGNGDDNGGDDNGGGGSGDNDDDSGILDKLLDAIIGLFKSIGKIIAAVLTGIVELLSSILETIADITTSFEGITNLFSAVFGWLPDPIINLMVLGLGLALLAAFITWFR